MKFIQVIIDIRSLISYVENRGHDFRYAIETKKINEVLNWYLSFPLNMVLEIQ